MPGFRIESVTICRSHPDDETHRPCAFHGLGLSVVAPSAYMPELVGPEDGTHVKGDRWTGGLWLRPVWLFQIFGKFGKRMQVAGSTAMKTSGSGDGSTCNRAAMYSLRLSSDMIGTIRSADQE